MGEDREGGEGEDDAQEAGGEPGGAQHVAPDLQEPEIEGWMDVAITEVVRDLWEGRGAEIERPDGGGVEGRGGPGGAGVAGGEEEGIGFVIFRGAQEGDDGEKQGGEDEDGGFGAHAT
jgi:hypothetical protein